MTHFQELTIKSTSYEDYTDKLRDVFKSLGMNAEQADYKASDTYREYRNRHYKHRIDGRPNFGYATWNSRPGEFPDAFMLVGALTTQCGFLLDTDFQQVRIYHDEKTKCATVCFYAKDKVVFSGAKITLTLTDLRKLATLDTDEEAAVPYLKAKDKDELSKGDKKILLALKFKTLLNEIKKTVSLDKRRGFKMQHKI